MRTAAVYRISLASAEPLAESGGYRDTLGSVFDEIGGYDEAVNDLRKALKVCPLPKSEHRITHDEYISGAEILMLAQLDDQLEARLSNIAELSEAQKGSLLTGAVFHRDLTVVKTLVSSGIPPNSLDLVGYNAITAAVDARSQSADKICFFWHAGIDPFLQIDELSSIHKAVMSDNLESLRVLLAIAVKEGRNLDSQIELAIEIGRKVDFRSIDLLKDYPNLDFSVEDFCGPQ